ncbi:MAG: hypothetical protein R3Y32_07110 [Bacillota bacterium]
MPKDLKAYIKNNKANKTSPLNGKNAEKFADDLSSLSQTEASDQFAKMLAISKQNGTLNKSEMLQMLSQIKNNMSNAEYQKMRSIIQNL